MIRTPREAGLVLRSLREEQGLTQLQVAERAGVSPRWLVSFEGGKGSVDMSRVLDCFQVLGYAMEITRIPAGKTHG